MELVVLVVLVVLAAQEGLLELVVLADQVVLVDQADQAARVVDERVQEQTRKFKYSIESD
ncbi:MAG: hypothetical protein ACOVLE_16935 [Pirellula staleyi]